MEIDFWDKRYSENEYAYGIEPNKFFKQEINSLSPGKLLLPGEGEGRNAVYAAKKGWDVTALDFSISGKTKAMNLANNNGVNFEYIVSSIEDYVFPENCFDLIALIFVHFSSGSREKLHKSLIKSLKKDGVIIVEAFSKTQINNTSGGPKDVLSLYCIEDFQNDFSDLYIESLTEHKTGLSEGLYHKGAADVIRLKAINK